MIVAELLPLKMYPFALSFIYYIKVSCSLYFNSRLSLSRHRLSGIAAYLKEKI